MSVEKLSQVLWRERELLESLLYKLDVERLILSAGESRWLARAATEVESLLDLLRETEMLRAVVADEVALEVGLEHNTSLRSLSAAVEEPWRSILDDHRESFEQIVREVTEVAAQGRELISAGLRSTREVLLSLDEQSVGYGADGAARTTSGERTLIDRSL